MVRFPQLTLRFGIRWNEYNYEWQRKVSSKGYGSAAPGGNDKLIKRKINKLNCILGVLALIPLVSTGVLAVPVRDVVVSVRILTLCPRIVQRGGIQTTIPLLPFGGRLPTGGC